jgi:hypothetical protein
MAVAGWGYLQIFDIKQPWTYITMFKTWSTVFKMINIFDEGSVLMCLEMEGYIEIIDL